MTVFSDAVDDVYGMDDLVKEALLTHGETVSGLPVFFTAPYRTVSPFDGEVATTAPRARCRAADVAAAACGDTLAIDSTVYTITAIEPLEQGLEKILVLTRS